MARIYVVNELSDVGSGGIQYLVEANNPSQAIRHTVKDRFTAKAATSSDVARLMKAGFEVEQAVVDESDPANVA